MPDAVIIQIADALVAALNAGGFSQAFTAERVYVPITELKDEKDAAPHGYVCLPSLASEMMDREDVSRQNTLQVGVVWKVQSENDKSGIDAGVYLVEEVLKFIETNRRVFDGAVCVAANADPLVSPEALVKNHLFVGVIKVTYLSAGGNDE